MRIQKMERYGSASDESCMASITPGGKYAITNITAATGTINSFSYFVPDACPKTSTAKLLERERYNNDATIHTG